MVDCERLIPDFYGADVAGKPQSSIFFRGNRSPDCYGRIESNRPDDGAGKRSKCMRVASLESVLTAATLISAIVVVLWGMKIFYGA